MVAPEFTFIQMVPNGGSRRARRLQLSTAKSHAAYSGYRARQARTTRSDGFAKSIHLGNIYSLETSLGMDSREAKQEEYDECAAKQVLSTQASDSIRALQYYSGLNLQFEVSQGLRRDPFLCNPNNEAGDGALIDFLSHDIGPINESVAFVFNTTNIASGMLEILTQDNFYHTLLCILQSMDDQLRSPALSPSVGVLRRKGRAMAEVRKGLNEPKNVIDDAVLCAIVLLAVLEGRFQATTVRDVHKKTLAAITSRRGGLASFPDGSVFKASVMQFDTFWTWETGRTMFPNQRRRHEPTYPSKPLSMKIIQDLPSGFRDLCLEGALSYDLLPVLTRAAYFADMEPLQRVKFLLEARNQKKAFNDFWEACPCLGPPDNKYHPMERLLTMSIMYFVYGSFDPRAFPTGPLGPTPDLTLKFISYEPKTKAEEACLQWMWILAIDLLWAGNQQSFDDCSSVFQLQLRYPAFRSVKAVLDLAPKFLWTKEMSIAVQAYWRDVIGGTGD